MVRGAYITHVHVNVAEETQLYSRKTDGLYYDLVP